MASELLSCPFCGGEISERVSNFGVSLMFFECHDCGATVSFNEDVCNYAASVGDYAPSIMAFNQRAERTCKPIDEYSCGVPSCGNCGVTLNMVTSGVRPFNKVLPNYCHNCGAKVVE